MTQGRPLIAIVGRPNVGKSRLFNRLTGSRDAIVEDIPGVTRDRHYGDGEWYGKAYSVVDTGGFDPDSEDVLLKQMREQAQVAIDEAELIFFVTDGRSGLTSSDEEIARQLRMSDKLVFLVVNKIDGPRHEPLVADFYSLGFETLYPISAEHGYMVDELMDEVLPFLPSLDKIRKSQEDQAGPLKVAVVGKPNAGKSSLINKLLGTERLLTSDIPGTTRDTIDTLLTRDGREYLMIDTAGIRKKRSIALLVEKYAVVKAFKAIDRSDVVLYMMDSTAGVTEQDRRLVRLAQAKGRPHIFLMNKWDLVEKDSGTAGEFVKKLREDMRFEAYAPIIFISALSGQRVHKIFKVIDDVQEQWSRRISTGQLNRWFRSLTTRHTAPVKRGRAVRFYYIAQVAVRPPTFLVSCSAPESVTAAYRRFLLNRMREAYGFDGTPLKLFFRKHGSRRRGSNARLDAAFEDGAFEAEGGSEDAVREAIRIERDDPEGFGV